MNPLVEHPVLSRSQPPCLALFTGAEILGVTTLRPPGTPNAHDGVASLPLLELRLGGKGTVPSSMQCEVLLVATGRTPNVEGMGLEAAGIKCAP